MNTYMYQFTRSSKIEMLPIKTFYLQSFWQIWTWIFWKLSKFLQREHQMPMKIPSTTVSLYSEARFNVGIYSTNKFNKIKTRRRWYVSSEYKAFDQLPILRTTLTLSCGFKTTIYIRQEWECSIYNTLQYKYFHNSKIIFNSKIRWYSNI